MTDKPDWSLAYERLKTAFDAIPAGGALPEATRALVRDTFNAVDDVNRRMYIFGRLDPDLMAAFAKQGDIVWWPVIYGRAFFNDLDGLKSVWAAAPETERTVATSTVAFKWVSESYAITDTVQNSLNPKIIRQLLDWKADVNTDEGKWLEKSLRALDADSIRMIIDGGAAAATVFRVMGELIEKKDFTQAGKIQEALARAPVYFKIDAHTLMESKFIPDAQGGATYKALFNFRARRVNEIYEHGGKEPRTAMTSVSFDDYDRAAIGFAEETLLKLGGKAVDTIGKPKLRGLSG